MKRLWNYIRSWWAPPQAELPWTQIVISRDGVAVGMVKEWDSDSGLLLDVMIFLPKWEGPDPWVSPWAWTQEVTLTVTEGPPPRVITAVRGQIHTPGMWSSFVATPDTALLSSCQFSPEQGAGQ